jgi:hypothetical protein
MAARDNGFDKRPQDINRKGRPTKEHSLTDLLKVALEQPHDQTGKTKKQAVIDKIYELAVEKEDPNMLKYLFDRIDGKPMQSIQADVESDNNMNVTVEFIKSEHKSKAK